MGFREFRRIPPKQRTKDSGLEIVHRQNICIEWKDFWWVLQLKLFQQEIKRLSRQLLIYLDRFQMGDCLEPQDSL